jgi:hypothetical protein
MSKEAVFTMKLEPELRAEFMAMREFVQRQREAREYEAFLRSKVASAREQISAGDYASADDVEEGFAERRAKLLAKAGTTGA